MIPGSANPLLLGQDGAGGYEIERSLRFNSGDSAYLNRTPSAAGNTNTWTLSFWVKRAGLGATNCILMSYNGSSIAEADYATLEFSSDDSFRVGYAYAAYKKTTRVFRDPSAWYHIVVVIDTTNSTAGDRVQIYVNGAKETSFSATHDPDLNQDLAWNKASFIHRLGSEYNQFYSNLYLADVHFIDGQALAPTDFGETDNNDVWRPKEFAGTYTTTATGTMYSGMLTSSSGFNSAYPATNAFDNSLTTKANNTNNSDNYIEFTPTTPISFTNGVYVNAYAANGYNITNYWSVDLDGNGLGSETTFVGGGANFNNNAWVQVATGSGTLHKLRIRLTRGGGDASGASIHAIAINGTDVSNYILDGTTAQGANSFHLDFADNSSNAALGTDTSGVSPANTWTVNNLTASVATANAIDLDGNDQIEYPGPGDGISGDFTMECFFLMDSSASGYQRIFSTKEDSYSDEQTIIRRHTNGNLQFYVGNGSPADQMGSTITSGIWHHAAIVRSSGTVSYYYDGSRLGTDSYSTSFDITKLVVGGGYGSEQFNGDVHGARFTLGQALYSGSSYTVPTSPITTTSQSATASNVKVLAGTTSTVNENAGTLGNGTNSGDPTAVSAYPFGDPVNIDSLVDTPNNGTQTDTGAGGEITGNYATFNPLDKTSGITLSDGNLKATGQANGSDRVRGTIAIPRSGKWYFEFTLGSAFYGYIGISNIDGTKLVGRNEDGRKYTEAGHVSTPFASITAGDIVGVALDNNTTLTFYKNGVAESTTVTVDSNTDYFAMANFYNAIYILNSGQRAFAYAAPSGYKSLNTANLSSTIADGSLYFDTKLWTGNGSSQTVANYNFSPDFVWIKNRSDGSEHHALFDQIRGATKVLYSSLTNAEATQASGLSAFTSDGFSLGSDGKVNKSGDGQVGWAWDAGANSDKTYAITVANPGSGNKYYADGALQPTLTLAEGSTYKFDQSAATNSGHPLRFSTTSDGTHGGGSEYTTGVTTAGTPGSAGAFTQIVIAASAPTLYAYCTNHSGMGFQVNTSDTEGSTIVPGGLNSSVYNQSQTWSNHLTASGSGFRSGNPATNAFNAGSQNAVTNDNNGTLTLDLSSYNLSGPIRVKFGTGNSGTYTATFVGSSGTQTDSQSYAATQPGAYTNSYNVGTITSVSVTTTSNSQMNLVAVEINGKELVDSGVTPPNVPSIASTVRANPSAGFSIVTYTGNGTNDATFGHGLNATPEFIIVKRTDSADDWFVYSLPTAGNILKLNATAAKSGSSHFRTMSSSTFQLSGNSDVNANNGTFVAYCFAPVEGYSAMGSYTGNSNSDGIFVYTGFRTKWIMIKRSSTTSGWAIYDTTRGTYNSNTPELLANTNAAESAVSNRFDILSNGFKFRSSSFPNDSATFIYIAFASNPFSSNGGLAR